MRVQNFLFASSCLLLASLSHSAPAINFVAEIPFHDCKGMICLDVHLDGDAVRSFVLDTGDVNPTVSQETAKALGWTFEEIKQDDKVVPGMFRAGAHPVGLGATNISVRFISFDPNALGDYPLPGDGSLTYTAFKDRIIQIDYPHHMFRVSDVFDGSGSADPMASGNPPGTLQLITFGKQGPPIVVGKPFTVNGKTVAAQIDTCYTGTLLVYDDAVAKLGLMKQGKPEFFPDTDGGVNMLATPAKSLGFGKITLLGNNPTMYFVGEGKNPVHQPDGLFEATVGNALLAHSIVTMDLHALVLDVRVPEKGS